MSATDRSEVRQYVVRSKTPSNSEKVLLYLRGMERLPPAVPTVDEEQDPNFIPPGSDDIPDHHPLSPRSKPSEPDRRATVDSQGTHITYTDAGRPQPISPSQAGFNQPELRMPDPKHISDQSWQSWGNKGPLPNDGNRSTGGADLGMSWGGHAVFPQPQTNQYSFATSGYPAGPTSGAASPQPIQINLTIVPPSDKTSHAGSRASGFHHDDIPEIEDDELGELRGPSRYESHSPLGGSNHPSRRPPSAVASQPAAEGWGDWEAVDHPGREPSHAPSGRPLIDELNAAQSRAPQSRTPVGQSRTPGGKPVSNAPSTRQPPSAVRPPASHTPGSAAPGQRPSGSQFGGSRVTQMHPLSNRIPSEAPGGRPRATSPTHNADYQPLIFSGASAAPSAPPHPEAFRYQVQSPTTNEDFMNEEEEEMVNELLTRTPRTSYTVTPSVLAAEVQHSHHHDEDLCVLLHAADDTGMHEIVKRAVRKAIRSRLKKLGMKGDNDAIRAYRDVHNWEFHTERPPNGKQDGQGGDEAAPPPWARQLLDALRQSQERLAVVEKQLQQSKRHEQEHEEDDVRSNATARPEGSVDERHRRLSDVSEFPRGDYGVGSPLIRGETELDATEHYAPDSRHGDEDRDTVGMGMRSIGGQTPPHQDGGARHALRDFMRSDQGSLGDQVYEQELYKLRMKPTRTGATHQTWDMTRADPNELMPEIPDSDAGFQGGDMYHDQRGPSPGPTKGDAHNWQTPAPAPWQKIHQTLLDWAVAWSPSELDKALNSTTRGNQVDSLALSVWTMQTYKRYVRLKLSENPPGNIDKMFVPPIIADVVSNAVFSGRHAEASDQLHKLWNDFGLKASPRQIIVLAPNKRQENHWVVHRFDLSECTLNTYDTSIEKSPPDSRPLGWWFAIKAAFPSVPAPQSGHLYQNHVRMPRPLQYIIDNSVAAAAIWRNLLMSAKAERAIDLERLRDLINTEVKNLRQRKEMGKLTAAVHALAWEQVGS